MKSLAIAGVETSLDALLGACFARLGRERPIANGKSGLGEGGRIVGFPDVALKSRAVLAQVMPEPGKVGPVTRRKQFGVRGTSVGNGLQVGEQFVKNGAPICACADMCDGWVFVHPALPDIFSACYGA